jgi:hypothetical protein
MNAHCQQSRYDRNVILLRIDGNVERIGESASDIQEKAKTEESGAIKESGFGSMSSVRE